MIKVVGLWELGWNTPIMEYELWVHLLKDFGVDEWVMSPVSGINKPNITEVPDIMEFINDEVSVVFVEEEGETDLADFIHPTNATYVLGKSGFSAWKSLGKKGISVRISTPTRMGGLWAHQAIAIVLYDRVMKNDRNGI